MASEQQRGQDRRRSEDNALTASSTRPRPSLSARQNLAYCAAAYSARRTREIAAKLRAEDDAR